MTFTFVRHFSFDVIWKKNSVKAAKLGDRVFATFCQFRDFFSFQFRLILSGGLLHLETRTGVT